MRKSRHQKQAWRGGSFQGSSTNLSQAEIIQACLGCSVQPPSIVWMQTQRAWPYFSPALPTSLNFQVSHKTPLQSRPTHPGSWTQKLQGSQTRVLNCLVRDTAWAGGGGRDAWQVWGIEAEKITDGAIWGLQVNMIVLQSICGKWN